MWALNAHSLPSDQGAALRNQMVAIGKEQVSCTPPPHPPGPSPGVSCSWGPGEWEGQEQGMGGGHPGLGTSSEVGTEVSWLWESYVCSSSACVSMYTCTCVHMCVSVQGCTLGGGRKVRGQ
jgi:hypothetical protein